MNTEDEQLFELDYDEEAAVIFIQAYLPQELKDKFSEDTIYYLLDTICDFYDARDFFEDEDEEKEEKELAEYLISQLKKDDIGNFSLEEITLFLRAEEAYADTLDM